MNNPLILLALINTIHDIETSTKQHILESNYNKKNMNEYYTKPNYHYSIKKKNIRPINQPRNRGTNHMKAIRQPKNITY